MLTQHPEFQHEPQKPPKKKPPKTRKLGNLETYVLFFSETSPEYMLWRLWKLTRTY